MCSGRQPIRILFLALIPTLFLQFAFSLVYEEPYPAISFPRFASAPNEPGRIRTTEWTLRVLFRDGSSQVISRNEFLRGAANSHREFIMRLHFASGSFSDTDRRRELRNWTLRRCREVTGRSDVSALLVERYVVTRTDSRWPEILSTETEDNFLMELQ
jgi:hypothetical protein